VSRKAAGYPIDPATCRRRIVEIEPRRSSLSLTVEGSHMATKGKLGDPGTREHPWHLKTPSGTSEFQAFRDEKLDPPALVVKSGSTELRYHLRCINDLHQMLKSNGDWMLLGS